MKYYATRDLERAGVVADGIDQLIPVLEALEEMKTISVEDHDRCLNKMIDQMWDDLLKRNPKADREEAVQMTNLMRLVAFDPQRRALYGSHKERQRIVDMVLRFYERN